MSRRRLFLAIVVVVGLAVGTTTVWLVARDSGDGRDGSTTTTAVGPDGLATQEPVAVALGEPGDAVAFEFASTEHELELVELVGRSAHLRLSSSPVELRLTAGVDTPVDLTGDTTPDATATLDVDGDDGPTVIFAVPDPDLWDETGFATEGLLRPAHATGSSGTSATQLSLVEEADGTLAIFYLAMDRTLRWQRNAPAGDFVAAPVLEAGTVQRPFGPDKSVVATSVVGVDGGFVAAQAVDGRGVAVQQLDGRMRLTAPPLVLDTLAWPSLAVTEDGLLLAAQEGSAIALLELTTSTTGPAVGRWTAITTPEASTSDRYPQLAVDGEQAVVLYERRPRSGASTLRAAVASLDGAVLDDVLVTDSWYPTGRQASAPGPTIVVDGDEATVLWRRSVSGSVRLFLSRVSLSSGTVDAVLDAAPRSDATTDLFGHSAGYRLVHVQGATRLLALNPLHPVQPTVDRLSKAPVFTLHDLETDGIAGDPLVLDGGLPVRADLLVELDGYAQNPDLAIAGQPVTIEGAVTNRGQRSATSSTVEVRVAGTVVDTLPLGSVAAQRTVRFALGWTPPIDTTERTLPVGIHVATTADQYTLDNDTADFTLQVCQTGIVSGWLADVSRDLLRESDWLPGVPGATVTLGTGQQVLTDASGHFRIEDVEFGATTLTATKDGFKPAEGEISISRSQPFAYVRMYTDDHGVLVVHVVDAEGLAVPGVALQLLGGPSTQTDRDGNVRYDLSAGTYDVLAVKQGFWPAGPEAMEVVFDEERTEELVLEPAVEGIVGGQVVGARGQPLPDATVTITPQDPDEAARTVPVDATGRFGGIRLPAVPVASYSITATSPSEAGTGGWDLALHGGEIRSEILVVAPEGAGLGELRLATAVEGYTSWMIKAGWPGFWKLPSAAMYAWYGNHSIRVGAEYWSGTHELVGVDVSVEGNSYETHATKSEIDLTDMRGDYDQLFQTTKFSDEHLDAGVNLFEILTGSTEQYVSGLIDAVLDVGPDIQDLFTGETDEWLILGQGSELLTWAQAKEDFEVFTDIDTSSPSGTAYGIFENATRVPRGFAIPIVIGGSSDQWTSVRVDQVDVVDVATRETLWSTGEDQWSSWSDGTGNQSTTHFDVDEEGIAVEDVFVYVWLRVGKIYPSELDDGAGGPTVHQTGFEQRAQQVVIFRPATQTMIARIAPGDPYRHAELLHLPEQ